MRVLLALATAALLFVALRYGVVGISGLATYRRETPLVYWMGVGVLLVMLFGAVLSLIGLF